MAANTRPENETGIEVELRPFIERIRADFPDVKIYTERVTSDTPMEMWYFEEGETKTTREWFDSFTQLQHFLAYYVPDTTNVGAIQSRLRFMRRWISTNFLWIPFVKDLNITQEDGNDCLRITFALWRRYRLVYPQAPKMRSLIVEEEH